MSHEQKVTQRLALMPHPFAPHLLAFHDNYKKNVTKRKKNIIQTHQAISSSNVLRNISTVEI
jgi:hypothetical protein